MNKNAAMKTLSLLLPILFAWTPARADAPLQSFRHELKSILDKAVANDYQSRKSKLDVDIQKADVLNKTAHFLPSLAQCTIVLPVSHE